MIPGEHPSFDEIVPGYHDAFDGVVPGCHCSINQVRPLSWPGYHGFPGYQVTFPRYQTKLSEIFLINFCLYLNLNWVKLSSWPIALFQNKWLRYGFLITLKLHDYIRRLEYLRWQICRKIGPFWVPSFVHGASLFPASVEIFEKHIRFLLKTNKWNQKKSRLFITTAMKSYCHGPLPWNKLRFMTVNALPRWKVW